MWSFGLRKDPIKVNPFEKQSPGGERSFHPGLGWVIKGIIRIIVGSWGLCRGSYGYRVSTQLGYRSTGTNQYFMECRLWVLICSCGVCVCLVKITPTQTQPKAQQILFLDLNPRPWVPEKTHKIFKVVIFSNSRALRSLFCSWWKTWSDPSLLFAGNLNVLNLEISFLIEVT